MQWAANWETVNTINNELIPALNNLKSTIEADGTALKNSFRANENGLGAHHDDYDAWVTAAVNSVDSNTAESITGVVTALQNLQQKIADWLG